MTKGLEKLEGLEAGDTVTVKFVADADDEKYYHPNLDVLCISRNQITEIVSVEKKPKPLVGYVNVYGSKLGNLNRTKEDADFVSSTERTNILKITANPATGEYSIEEVKG